MNKEMSTQHREHELSYFDGPGRAEGIRILLHAAGINFIDTRFDYSEWQSAIKDSTPLHQVPTLRIGDTAYVQSLALIRYAAKKARFYPKDDMECLLVDEMMETCNEIGSDCPIDTDLEVLKLKRKAWQDSALTRFANVIERRLARNTAPGTIGRPSVADLLIKNVVDTVESGFFEYVDTRFFDSYQHIQ